MKVGSDAFQYTVVDDFLQVPTAFKRDLGIVSGIGVDQSDTIYVYARGNPRLSRWTSHGVWIDEIGRNISSSAHGIWNRSNGEIFCTDHEAHSIFHLDSNGILLETYGVPGIEAKIPGKPFNKPTDCCVDEETGTLYVSDGYGNTHIHGYKEGKHLFTWGSKGTGRDELILPHCVRCDAERRIWVCDRENNRIVIYDSSGTVVDIWDQLLRPAGLWLDSKNHVVFIAELDYRMSILSMGGSLLARWNTKDIGLAGFPHGICLDSSGSIYVAHTEIQGKVVKYAHIPSLS